MNHLRTGLEPPILPSLMQTNCVSVVLRKHKRVEWLVTMLAGLVGEVRKIKCCHKSALDVIANLLLSRDMCVLLFTRRKRLKGTWARISHRSPLLFESATTRSFVTDNLARKIL